MRQGSKVQDSRFDLQGPGFACAHSLLQTELLLGIEWRPRPSSSNRPHPSTFCTLPLPTWTELTSSTLAFSSAATPLLPICHCLVRPACPLIQASRFDDTPISDRPCLALAKPISCGCGMWVQLSSGRRIVESSLGTLLGLGCWGAASSWPVYSATPPLPWSPPTSPDAHDVCEVMFSGCRSHLFLFLLHVAVLRMR